MPSPATRTRRAVVLCHPFGQEYVRAHRSMRKLAEQLCQQGFTVLRFDYFGTGDSQGPSSDVSFAGFVSDVDSAIDEIKETAEVRSVALVGLRLGAAVAASLLGGDRRRDIDRIVLWDPTIRGRSLLDEAASSSRPPVPRDRERGGGIEFMGFPWPASFIGELEAVDVRPLLRSASPPVLALYTRDPAEPKLEEGEFPAPGSRVLAVDAPPAWVKQGEFGPGAIPVPAIDAIVTWLGEWRR